MGTYLWYFKVPKEYTRLLDTNNIQKYLETMLLKVCYIRTTVVREHKEFYYGFIHLKQKVNDHCITDKLPNYFTFYKGDIRRHMYDFYKIIAEEVFTNGRLLFK